MTALLLFLLLAPPLHAATQAAWYRVYWGPMHIGNLVAEVQEDATSYRIKVDMVALGLARSISKYKSLTTVEGIREGKDYIPQRFETWSRTRKSGEKRITLFWDRQRRIISDSYSPPDPVWKRKKVPDGQRNGAYDTLTMIPLVWQKLREWKAGTAPVSYSTPMYDGRRLADLRLRYVGAKDDLLGFRFRRDPIAGFTDKEIKKMQNQEPDITIWVEDNAGMLPVKASGAALIGSATAELAARCPDFATCKAKSVE
jgi:hypothetical protein